MIYPLFFSGGSAIGKLAHYFAHKDIPTAHIVTTFDNGGSTAELRKHFAMPAIGDLRNRILELASPLTPPAIIRLLKLRLSPIASANKLQLQLERIANPENGNWTKMPAQASLLIRTGLDYFLAQKPKNFNLAKASIGNLVLAGFYLHNNRDLQAALQPFIHLLQICGFVAPITLAHLQLGAILQDGMVVIGQDKFENLSASIKDIFLTVHEVNNIDSSTPCHAPISDNARQLIQNAGLICYSPGSFYSSLLVNLLVNGVTDAITSNKAPKIFIPNSGGDPESANLDIYTQVKIILGTLAFQKRTTIQELLNFVLIDKKNGSYSGKLERDCKKIIELGIEILDVPIVAPNKPGAHMPAPTARIILEIEKNNA